MEAQNDQQKRKDHDEMTSNTETSLRRRRPVVLERWRAVKERNRADRPASATLKKSAIEDFYRVDTVTAGNSSSLLSSRRNTEAAQTSLKAQTTDFVTSELTHPPAAPKKNKQVRVLLPGVPHYDDDWARDSHDFFNLVVLVPVSVLNVMNWNWDKLATMFHQGSAEAALQTLQDSWTGDWFNAFFTVTMAYFFLDLLWIVLQPSCVKSPGIILQHHLATILYVLIPLYHKPVRYCMGACLTVEVNTWFLIARRVFNKQGFPPWTFKITGWWSLRVKVISIFFYLTWISIRCILYPALLVLFYQHWRDHTRQMGTWINILLPSVPLHACFCLLNLKWTYELILSKVRYSRRYRRSRGIRGGTVYEDSSVSKGL